jgi:hypothetical protein
LRGFFRQEVKHAEEDLKLLYPEQWKLLHPEQSEPEDDGTGKRPGQFGIFDLLVLMTFAGVACAIVRLPIHFAFRMVAISLVWLGFSFWALGKPDAKKYRSLAYKRRAAILHAVGSMLTITPFIFRIYEQSSRLPAMTGFMLPLLIGPVLAIWRAGRAVQAERIGRQKNSKGRGTTG